MPETDSPANNLEKEKQPVDKKSSLNYLQEQFNHIIDGLEVNDLSKEYLKSRWLDQLCWFDKRARQFTQRSRSLQLTTIIGSTLLPALVSLNLNQFASAEPDVGLNVIFHFLPSNLGLVTFVLSQVVAICAAIDQFLKYGEKAILYRQAAEFLKSEGWKYFMLVSPYQKFSDHQAGYRRFVFAVEEAIQQDVKTYIQLTKQNIEEAEAQEGQGSKESVDKNDAGAMG